MRLRVLFVAALGSCFVNAKLLRSNDVRQTIDDGSHTPVESHKSRNLLGLIDAGNNGDPSEAFPLDRCEGDCDSDDDCATGLLCFERDALEAVPGCDGDGTSGIDYCYDPNITTVSAPPKSTSTLTVQGDAGSPSDAFPLGPCEGDCDTDSDCADGLVCFSRSAFEEVPGCQGKGIYAKDYCYDPNHLYGPTAVPTDVPSLLPSAAPFMGPTAAPVPTTPLPSAVPTITPVPTVAPTPLPALENVGDGGHPSSAFPLGKCQGDCDVDADCATGLYCFARSGDEEIPGCSGSGDSGRDYCFDNMDYPSNNNGGGPYFRLKKWWQVGYYWQESHDETWWCLVCDSDCKLQTCDQDSTRFALIANGDLGVQLQIAESDRCIERVRERAIEVHSCDSSNVEQYFKGAFNQINFEIHPYNLTDRCLTSHHQPKADEVVLADLCSLSRRAKSSLWMKY